jgi:hypothetical protein
MMIGNIKKFLASDAFLEKSPIITTVLLESANVLQLCRMVTEHSALGQNAWAWISVNVALWLWVNFYYQKKLGTAGITTLLGVSINALVILTVSYYRADHLTGAIGFTTLLLAFLTLRGFLKK